MNPDNISQTINSDGEPQSAAVQAPGTTTDIQPAPSPKPPRGPRLRMIVVGAAVLVITLWIGAAGGPHIANGLHSLSRALHPVATAAQTETPRQWYTCAMHKWVLQSKPGNCPVCGMKLVPLDVKDLAGPLTINPVVAQDIGIRVTPVTRGPVVRTIRTVGTVAYDEPMLRDVNMKVGGWIETLHVDYLGQAVHKGDPLFELYSPELYAAQQEYLLAWNNRNKVGAEFLPDAAQGATDLLAAARTKLEYFDVTQQQIQQLQNRGTPAKTMTILSPADGVVIAKHAVEGQKLEPGMQVYRIADLSRVWVMATLYEYQLPYVQLGQRATMSLSYLPGEQFQGKVIYIYPYLSDKTRQVDVRLEFENPTGLLKPGMYATIDLHSMLAKDRTLAPRSAVIDTGTRNVAFVSLGDGRFEPRNVQIGAEAQEGMIEILDGLKPGEKVVTSGQFLIDSEANTREALAKMIRGELSADQKPTVATVGSSEVKTLPDAAANSLRSILSDYLAIQRNLAADSLEAVSSPASAIARQVDELLKVNIQNDAHFWHKHEEVAAIRGKALELAQAKSLDDARLAFADLSIALDKLLKTTGVPQGFGQEVQELHCPMYRQGQGGTIWLQTAGPVANPYFGSAMPGCFDQRKALPVTGQAATSTQPAAPATQPPTTAPTVSISASQQQAVDELAIAYLNTHDLLVKDELEGVPDLLKNVHEAAGRLSSGASPALTAAAEGVAQASDSKPENLDEARVAYKQLSAAVIALVQLVPPTAGTAATLYQIHCPMTKGDWLQTSDAIANPYYGQRMLTCGEVVAKFNGTHAK